MTIPEFGTVRWFDWCACLYLLVCALPFDGAMLAAPICIMSGVFGWWIECLQSRPLPVYVEMFFMEFKQ